MLVPPRTQRRDECFSVEFASQIGIAVNTSDLFQRNARGDVEHDFGNHVAIRDAKKPCHAIATERGVQRDRSPKEFRRALNARLGPNPRVYRGAVRYPINLRIGKDIARNNKVVRLDSHAGILAGYGTGVPGRLPRQGDLDRRNPTAYTGLPPLQLWESTMATGTVKWFNTQKGFGFIQPDDGGKDVFVHISAVERAGMGSLVDGQKISYDVQMDRGKPAATNLSAK